MQYGIDWLTLRQPNRGQFVKINDGHVVVYKPTGEVEYTTDRHLTVEGSYETKARVRVTDEMAELSFNPARWERAHNVSQVSIDTAIAIANEFMRRHAGAEFTAGPIKTGNDGSKIYSGAVATRIDVCHNVATGSPENAIAFTRQLARTKLANVKTTRQGTTVYYGKKGQKRSRKAYIKAAEMRKNKSCIKAADYCDELGLVRLEATLRRDWLRENGMRAIQSLTEAKIERLVMPQIKEMKIETPDESLESLTMSERGVLRAWQSGDDIKSLVSQTAFYRYRKSIKRKTGYDIADDTITPFRKPREVIFIRELTDEEYGRFEEMA